MKEPLPLFIGGVLRCCVATLEEHEAKDGAQDEGTVLPCRYCTSALRVRNGAWEWYSEYGQR